MFGSSCSWRISKRKRGSLVPNVADMSGRMRIDKRPLIWLLE